MHRLKLLAEHLGRVLLNSGAADATLIGAASTNDPACGKPSVKLTLGILIFLSLLLNCKIQIQL